MIPEPSPRLRPEPHPLDDPGRPDPPPALLIWLTVFAVLLAVILVMVEATRPAESPLDTIPAPAYTVLTPVTVAP